MLSVVEDERKRARKNEGGLRRERRESLGEPLLIRELKPTLNDKVSSEKLYLY